MAQHQKVAIYLESWLDTWLHTSI